ncbi:MAG: conjugal transfer protein TrbD [Dehalococcoidia bacterium]|nr:conjugal transfer protein TrbD [Dehalococcoidia bacterium]
MIEEQPPRELPIVRATLRPFLTLGAETQPLLLIGGVCLIVALLSQDLATIAYCAVVWLVTLPMLRMVAKADPMMMRVYLRQLRYRNYYPARSTPWCVDRRR